MSRLYRFRDMANYVDPKNATCNTQSVIRVSVEGDFQIFIKLINVTKRGQRCGLTKLWKSNVIIFAAFEQFANVTDGRVETVIV